MDNSTDLESFIHQPHPRPHYNDGGGQHWRKARFYSQLFISVLIVIFCMFMVATETVGCERTVFMSVMTAILGFWLPQPKAQ